MVFTMSWVMFYVCCLLIIGAEAHLYLPKLPSTKYEDVQDFNLGVILPMHEHDPDEFCGAQLRELKVLQWSEAIAFAIREVNNNPVLLPNITLGFIMYDDCSKDQTSLLRASHFVQRSNPCVPSNCTLSTPGIVPMYKVFGVIGSEQSDNTIQISDFLTSFEIAHMSFSSSTRKLSNKKQFAHFQRVIPSDEEQITAVINILLKFKWTYIGLVYEYGSYGMEGYKTLREGLATQGICFAVVWEIDQDFYDYHYDDIIEDLKWRSNVNVIVVIAHMKKVYKLMEAVIRRNAIGRFLWIGTDGWSATNEDIAGVEEPAHGSLVINVLSRSVPRFDKFFRTLGPNNTNGNPWITEYFSKKYHCSPNGSNDICDGNLTFDGEPYYRPEKTVSLVMDTVSAFAFALQDLLWDTQNCSYNIDEYIREHMTYYISKVFFIGECFDLVYLDKYGDGQKDYELYNFQKVGDDYEYVRLATWQTQLFAMDWNNRTIQWPNDTIDPPKSACSEPCKTGERQVIKYIQCCWECEACNEDEISYMDGNMQRCKRCNTTKWPDETKTMCIPLRAQYMRWSEPLAVLFMSLSCIGILSCIAVCVVYIMKNQTVIAKASSRELSYIMLFGITVNYILVMTYIGIPSDAKCTVNAIGIQLSPTFIYAPLVTKANRMYRIFSAGKRTTRRPPFINTKSQIIIVLIIIMLNVSHICIYVYLFVSLGLCIFYISVYQSII